MTATTTTIATKQLTYVPQTTINGKENAKFSVVRKMLPCAVLMIDSMTGVDRQSFVW
jgi:hypothetical protein